MDNRFSQENRRVISNIALELGTLFRGPRFRHQQVLMHLRALWICWFYSPP